MKHKRSIDSATAFASLSESWLNRFIDLMVSIDTRLCFFSLWTKIPIVYTIGINVVCINIKRSQLPTN